MSNPFEELAAEVAKLEARYAELNVAIPKLEATKQAATEDLAKLNKDVVAAQAKLERLKEDIALQTESYNTWQAGQLAYLDKLTKELETDRSNFEDKMLAEQQRLDIDATNLEQAKKQLVADKVSLRRRLTDVNEQVRVNNQWADSLKGKDEAIKQAEADVATQLDAVTDRSVALDKREEKVAGAEEEARTLVQAAERDRKNARTLLATAKDKVGEIDARDQAQTMRERALLQKEQRLKIKEVQLNDRASVLSSNGL